MTRNIPLEIELPFFATSLKSEWKLLPIMGSRGGTACLSSIGKALAKVLQGKNAILVASTDLSHYYTQESALAFDNVMLSKIEAFDPMGASRGGTPKIKVSPAVSAR